MTLFESILTCTSIFILWNISRTPIAGVRIFIVTGHTGPHKVSNLLSSSLCYWLISTKMPTSFTPTTNSRFGSWYTLSNYIITSMYINKSVTIILTHTYCTNLPFLFVCFLGPYFSFWHCRFLYIQKKLCVNWMKILFSLCGI